MGSSAALLCVNRNTETVASNVQYIIPKAAALTERAMIFFGRPPRATPSGSPWNGRRIVENVLLRNG